MSTWPLWEERTQNTRQMIDAALEAAAPQYVLRRHLKREGDWIRAGTQKYHLPDFRRVLLLGFGKAAAAMAQVAEDMLGDWLTGGLIITQYRHALPLEDTVIVEAGHPLPDENGLAGAAQMLELVGEATKSDLIISLISGGGSALLTLPVPGISLGDLQVVNQLLLSSGVDIHEFNSVRKHLSQVKGGNLARTLYPAHVVALLLSDVVGNDEGVIASGPFSPDRSTFAQVWETLGVYGLRAELPQSVRVHLLRGLRGEIAENPSAGDRVFGRVQTVVVGDNQLAAQAAVKCANNMGFSSRLLTSSLRGEARAAASWIVKEARIARSVADGNSRPICLIAGGETTVRVRGDGKGGRNQELALAAAVEMAAGNDEGARLVCLASDGQDGPTDAAGALVECDSVARAAAAGMDARRYLENNDSYTFFSALGDLIVTGPTGTNVNDLLFWCWY